MNVEFFRCDNCGQFVKAELMHRTLLMPDSEFTAEEYETVCDGCKAEYSIDPEEKYSHEH